MTQSDLPAPSSRSSLGAGGPAFALLERAAMALETGKWKEAVRVARRATRGRRDDLPDMSFEAAWSPAGAVCVRRTRVPQAMTIEGLAAMCRRLEPARLGESCSEQSGARDGAILFNRSY